MEKQEMKYKDLDPYKDINFVERRALIKDKHGKAIFDELVEFPDFFSDDAVNIVSSKYLCNEAKRKETSLKQMIDRVSETIANWGLKDGYFGNEEKEDNEQYWEFLYKLKYYQINQYCAFNSPVYFNVGIIEKPQCGACYILDIEDDMESIYESIKIESLIFKHGSGSGMNMSKLRGCKERVHGGGMASGVCSFLKAADVSAGVIRSGGTFRRSAKLVCLNDNHPDIQKFIHCKELEEKKLKILKEAGISPEEGQEMSDHVFYQNTNISVRLSDEFMRAVEKNEEWWTKYILTGERCEKFSARELLREISDLAWRTGDPGVQFSDNINKWNTCKNSGDIEASNPCSEYMFLNSTNCDLASINLLKIFNRDMDNNFNIDMNKLEDIIRIVVISQDIVIDRSSYPTRKITINSHSFRPIGLGYSNLGAVLMWLGLPYDSDEGRNIAALLTALMTGVAFKVSNELSLNMGEFSKFEENKDPYYKVVKLHGKNVDNLLIHIINTFNKNGDLINLLSERTKSLWVYINELVNSESKFRNAQVTLLAPTGTISFLMDCATRGIEPEFSLISYKTLSGSGEATIKMVNQIIKRSLKNLGYLENEIDKLYDELLSLGHFENSEILKKEHLPIFDTAGVPRGGNRSIDYMGHAKMVAAVQPFLSGSSSKTVNLPNSVTVEDIYNLYLESWKMGIKGITVYRDGSKTYQPLNTSNKEEKIIKHSPRKIGMPATRPGEIHKFSIGSTEGYLVTGMYENGDLGETFLTVAKQGSTLSGLLDMLAIMISISLQHGVPLKTIVSKLMFSRFDPSGITSNPDIRFATSICDYLGRYLGHKYLSEEDKFELGLKKQDDKNEEFEDFEEISIINNIVEDSGGAPVCDCCGGMMQRVGTCFNCNNCGANSGACG